MPKIFTREEETKVWELHQAGLSQVDIVKRMNELFPGKWESSYSRKAVSRIIKEQSSAFNSALNVNTEKSLDEMTKEERYKYVQYKLENTPRFKLAFSNFNETDKSVFVDEYLGIIKSTESLTEVEEQALFMSVLELVLALKAAVRQEQEERYYEQSMNGEIPETDARFRRAVDDKYSKERDQHVKLYQSGLKDLKMSREQRLKEIRSGRKSLVDVVEELSHKSAQTEVINEIIRLSKLRDEELKKMIDNGHLIGHFEE